MNISIASKRSKCSFGTWSTVKEWVGEDLLGVEVWYDVLNMHHWYTKKSLEGTRSGEELTNHDKIENEGEIKSWWVAKKY